MVTKTQELSQDATATMARPEKEALDPSAVHVVLLKGGKSEEREVSLSSAKEVKKALDEAGFKVTEIDMADPRAIIELVETDADVAFICLHGRFGEDGTVQGLCELIGLPYTGSGVLSSALSMDKEQTKHVYARNNIPTPTSLTIRENEPFTLVQILHEIGQRTVIKPAREGSTIGITITYTPGEIEGALRKAFKIDPMVIVEKYVQGVETTVGVIGNDKLTALPVVEVVPAGDFYDFDSKYIPGMSEHIIPARISEENLKRCQEYALRAHKALGCRGFSRTDFIVDNDECWTLETNTIPGMTPTSLLPDAARVAGIPFTELCTTLVRLALEDHRA